MQFIVYSERERLKKIIKFVNYIKNLRFTFSNTALCHWKVLILCIMCDKFYCMPVNDTFICWPLVCEPKSARKSNL